MARPAFTPNAQHGNQRPDPTDKVRDEVCDKVKEPYHFVANFVAHFVARFVERSPREARSASAGILYPLN